MILSLNLIAQNPSSGCSIHPKDLKKLFKSFKRDIYAGMQGFERSGWVNSYVDDELVADPNLDCRGNAKGIYSMYMSYPLDNLNHWIHDPGKDVAGNSNFGINMSGNSICTDVDLTSDIVTDIVNELTNKFSVEIKGLNPAVNLVAAFTQMLKDSVNTQQYFNINLHIIKFRTDQVNYDLNFLTQDTCCRSAEGVNQYNRGGKIILGVYGLLIDKFLIREIRSIDFTNIISLSLTAAPSPDVAANIANINGSLKSEWNKRVKKKIKQNYSCNITAPIFVPLKYKAVSKN